MLAPVFDLDVIGAGLPVARSVAQLPELLGARNSGNLVVQAPPGTGKTTVIPPALANTVGGKVLVTAPRRVAVRAAARRMAHLDGSVVGERVGYSIKGEHHPGSLVEFVTPGVLLRRLLRDPELVGVRAVVVDEVHERQLDSDVLLAMLIELSQLRDDFSVVAMSATVDAPMFAQLLDADVLDTPAVTHPLDIRYHPMPGRIDVSRAFLDSLADAAVAAVAEFGHSALVFVPGVREVNAVVDRISSSSSTPPLPLHGSLSSAQQDAALRPSGQPRIVVATSIAESSLTVPGVRIVVDSGLSRVPRRDAARGMTGLVTVSAARSTSDQRAGRAGREGRGTVIRAYSAADFAHAAEHVTPEILTSDLTAAALHMACWGVSDDFPLPTSPPRAAMDQAWNTLEALHAVQAQEVTDTGRALATLPVDPRLGRALIEKGSGAAETVAVLADSPRGDIAALRASAREVRRLEKLVPHTSPVPAGVVVALAYPQFIARRVEDSEDYLLASGTRATLPADMGLSGSDWLAIAEVTRQNNRTGALIRAACRIDSANALDILPIEKTVEATVVNGTVKGREVRRVGAIELSSTPCRVAAEEASAALATHIVSAPGSRLATVRTMFKFSDAAMQLIERLNFLHQQLGDPWPHIDDVDLETWLGPELDALAHGSAAADMYAAVQRILPWPEAQHMDSLAPSRLSVPSGSQPRVDYAEGRPIVRVKLQECFGLDKSPEFAGATVLFHLLSPAGRPLAVTDDLASFWAGPYQHVRSEMRGRYPKHPWPEDPWSAPATARTKKRGG